jgi:lipoprotein-releasing system permease protein
VLITTPEGILTPSGRVPYPRRLRVAGTFTLGLYEFDTTMGFVTLETAERLFAKDSADLIQLRVDDIWAAADIARSLQQQLGESYTTQDWSSMNRQLFSALLLEKIAVSLAIGLIVMVAALNIIASLILLVMEKNRDIAILKTMGASARSVTVIFMLQGLIIGLAGTLVGGALGVSISRILDRYQLIRVPVDVYQISHLPFTVLPRDLFVVVSVAVLVCFFATIYPSRQAARLDPAQALRYE